MMAAQREQVLRAQLTSPQAIIDRILRAAHGNWKSLDESQRKTLRARFHNSKRYGKRWMLLTEKLGRGILLLCSPKLAKIV